MTTDFPQAVLFDMDGTLVDSEVVWDIGIEELAALLGGTLDPDVRARMVGTNEEPRSSCSSRASASRSRTPPSTSNGCARA
ncbi:hypothetical protein GCM10029992_43410 [Glycomyces albus]